jgi:O-6-methylguanine DNA methyltransferase
LNKTWRNPAFDLPRRAQSDNNSRMTKIESAIHAGQITSQMSFNQKVWALTARIPRGQVVTYADIAKKLKTRGYRAVGNALNKNPYAPAVPCHRVVGSNGNLTGFAGGLEKKKKMLQQEGITITDGKVNPEHLA